MPANRIPVTLLTISSALLVACALPPATSVATDLFDLRVTADGKAYRLNRNTGNVSVLESGIFKEIAEPGMPQLVVGRIYRAEDGKTTFKYLGDGRMERWGLDRYLLPDTPATNNK